QEHDEPNSVANNDENPTEANGILDRLILVRLLEEDEIKLEEPDEFIEDIELNEDSREKDSKEMSTEGGPPKKDESNFPFYDGPEKFYQGAIAWLQRPISPESGDVASVEELDDDQSGMATVDEDSNGDQGDAVGQRRLGEFTHSRNRVACEVCGKFVSKIYLREHKRIHEAKATGKKEHICEVCGREFAMRQYLRVHMTVHMQSLPAKVSEKPQQKQYECTVCGKVMTKGSVFRHQLSHLPDNDPRKMSKCGLCGKGVSRPNMARHLNWHNGRRYPCEICGNVYSYSTSLRDHMMSHTGECPYECSMCPERFNNIHKLRRHLVNHNQEILTIDE
ncbi:hypothetical protein PMAYCL1PPCAC_00242, partial [Pristionchus mayeri]